MSPKPDPRTPVLVGAAQYVQKTAPAQSLTAMEMVEKAARGALADTGSDLVLPALDTVLVVGFTVDAPEFPLALPKPKNPPRALGRRLGIAPSREIYTAMGGNTPQMAVNRLAEEIAEGRVEVALLAGAEFLHSLMALMRDGSDLSAWGEEDDAPTEVWGDPRDSNTKLERAHGLGFPTNTYPLIENAIRGDQGLTIEAHMAAMGKLMSPLSEVAAENPYAWFPTYRSPDEIATVTPKNRLVGFPYTKYMNAIIQVDQMAGLVMTSVEKARALGIPEDKWVYLHGCAEAYDHFYVTERPDLFRSPAIAGMGRKAFAMAGWSVDDIDHMDLYSCFPSAVEIGCRELGISQSDRRGLTVTGGLPYFGGPGNNYVMHSIATMVDRMRSTPGTKGLVTANGWYITKHAIGLYSTTPTDGVWSREAPSVLQGEIDALPKAPLIAEPSGPATIETYTVIHARDALRMGIVIGRDAQGRRFVANTPSDEATLKDLMAKDSLGRPGTVTSSEGGMKNIFTPD